jgi:hypothetical protein
VLIIGGLYWYRTTTQGKEPTPATAVVANGQVSFLDSQDNALGTTNALKVTATGLPNPPEGSRYDVWLVNTLSEEILPLGSLSKSDPTTFALSYPNDGSQSQATNLIGAGNKIEITQEQGRVTVPVGKIMLSATFPPQAFVHIRHLLFKFPTTPGNTGLLTGLVSEAQKVNSLALLLQSNTTSSRASVTCIAQSMVNVIEGKEGVHFRPLAANCASIGIGTAVTGDGFGILGNGYLATAAKHAALAASQPDTTKEIRKSAKDIEASTASVKEVMTNINNDLSQLLADPSTAASLVSDIVSLSNRAYHGFDQNGNGKIEPVVGEAGAQTAYTNGQLMAGLTLV